MGSGSYNKLGSAALPTSVADPDPDPWNPYHFRGIRIISLDPDPYKKMLDPESGSVSNDTDPDPTKTIENIK